MGARFTKIAAALLALAGWLAPANAADSDLADYLPVCYAKFGLCSYIDQYTKEERIPARFSVALPFSEGRAGVLIDGRFGYIDSRGEIVIPPRFDWGGPFHLGRAEVRIGRNAGVIDRTGQLIVPLQFARAVPLTKDVIVASEHPSQPDYLNNLDLFGRLPVAAAGLYHVDGHWIRRPGPDVKEFRTFETGGLGLIWASARVGNSNLVGLMASDGSWVVEPEFSQVEALFANRALVRKQIDGVVHSGAVDISGKLVVPMKPWILTSHWHNGQATVQQKPGLGLQKVGLVDERGDLIGGRWFDRVRRAETGDIAIVWPDGIDGRAVGLDRAGNLVANPRNGLVTASCSGGLRVVEIDGYSQITDVSGKPTSPHLFAKISWELNCDRPNMVRLGNKQGFVAVDGRLLFDPPRFDSQYEFSDGTARVQQNGKWGVIDTSGRFVVEAKFDEAWRNGDGLFRMRLNGSDFWFDAAGHERPAPPPAPRIGREQRARWLDCGHGVRLFSRDGLWGMLDGDKEIIAPKYRALGCFVFGIAFAPIEEKRQWCPVGPDGAVREWPPCRTEYTPLTALITHTEPEKLHDDPFESSVLWTRAYLEFADGRRDDEPRAVPLRPR